MGKATSKLLDDKIRACDSTTGPLEPHFRQFSKEWRIDEVVTLHQRFKKNPKGYGLVFSQFEALLSAKGGVKRVRDVFDEPIHPRQLRRVRRDSARQRPNLS